MSEDKPTTNPFVDLLRVFERVSSGDDDVTRDELYESLAYACTTIQTLALGLAAVHATTSSIAGVLPFIEVEQFKLSDVCRKEVSGAKQAAALLKIFTEAYAEDLEFSRRVEQMTRSQILASPEAYDDEQVACLRQLDTKVKNIDLGNPNHN